MLYVHTKTLSSVFKFLRFQNAFWKSSVFGEQYVRIRVDEGLTREIKFRFRDGLVWTDAGLTGKIKLRFQIPPSSKTQGLLVGTMRYFQASDIVGAKVYFKG